MRTEVTFKPRVSDIHSPVDPTAYVVKEDIRISEDVPKITTLFNTMRSALPMCEIKPMENHIANQYLKPSLVDSIDPEQRYDRVILCFQPKNIGDDEFEIAVRSSEEEDTMAKNLHCPILQKWINCLDHRHWNGALPLVFLFSELITWIGNHENQIYQNTGQC